VPHFKIDYASSNTLRKPLQTARIKKPLRACVLRHTSVKAKLRYLVSP